MIRVLVAMEREAKSLGAPCELIGIGAETLPETSPDDVLVNVGYAGGYKVHVGAVIEPLFSVNAKTGHVQYLETHFPCEKRPCLTADEFITEPLRAYPAIYDMELWKVAQLPHKALYALKIVSDNLDEADCESFNDETAWETVRRLLKAENLI